MTGENSEILVSVECLVYNHAKYLRNCLDGFVMQKTNFRYEVIVHDDASTDDSQAIIKEYAEKYPDIIKPILETENQYSKHDGSLRRIVESRLTGKYMAYCEGDDYWINPLKLQMQVDYMDTHPDCVMCFTDFDIKDDIKGIEEHSLFKTQPERFPCHYSLETWLYQAGYVAPMTWMTRRELWTDRPTIKTVDGSFLLFTSFLHKGNVHCIDEVTAVYRIAMGSATHTTSITKAYKRVRGLCDSQLNVAKYYKDAINDYDGVVRKIYLSYYRAFFLILYNNDKQEIKDAIQRLGSDITPYQRRLYRLSKIPFAIKLLGYVWRAKYMD